MNTKTKMNQTLCFRVHQYKAGVLGRDITQLLPYQFLFYFSKITLNI